jgi:protein phosphatase
MPEPTAFDCGRAAFIRRYDHGMRLSFGGRTDVGPMRYVNEDAFRIDAERGLVAVVDGCGGVSSGQVAARMACDAVMDLFARTDAAPSWPFPPDPLRSEAENRLVTAARIACRAIFERSTSDVHHRGMGATAVFGLFDAERERVSFAHVGGIHAFRMRQGRLAPLLRPHTLAFDLGFAIPPEEVERIAREHAGVMTRALGMAVDLCVESSSWRLDPGDVYVLASDGLDEIDDAAIAALVAARGASHPDQVASDLVDAVIAAGGRDNVTVAVVRCE